MNSTFSKERREMLKTSCTLIGAAALVPIGGSLSTFDAVAMPSMPSRGIPVTGDTFAFTAGAKKGNPVLVADIVLDALPVTVLAVDPATGKPRTYEGDTDNSTVLLYRVDPKLIEADMVSATVDGVMAYSAVCTHLGCLLSNWDAATKQFQCPCHDATFDPLKEGENTGGATARELSYIPVKAVGGKLVVAGEPSGYIGVKKGY